MPKLRAISGPAEARGGQRAALRNLAITTIVGSLIAYGLSLTALKDFERVAGDQRVANQTGVVEPRRDIAIIAIDDLATAGLPFQSPINRELLASIVEQLDRRGAKAIALDVVLDRPSFPVHDARLAAVLGSARAPIILGRDAGQQADAAACGAATGNKRSVSGLADPGAGEVLPVFGAKARMASLVVCIDDDGVVRRMPKDNADTSALASAIAAAVGESSAADGRAIPFDMAMGDRPSIAVYSAAHLDILPDDWIAGRVFVVGIVTPYSGDWFETPLRFSEAHLDTEPADRMPKGELPGAMVHAFGAAALVDGRRGRDLDFGMGFGLAIVGGVCGALIGAASIPWWVRALGGASLGVLSIVAITAIGPATGWLPPVTPFPLALAIAGGLLSAIEAQRFMEQRRLIRGAFERYLAPSVVNELIRNPSLVALGASEREISVLFTDLESFTRFVDSNPPARVADILNGYLDAITAVVIEHGGAVDKIVGDAVHAIFSAPLNDPEHRQHACACALAIDAASETYRVTVQEKYGIAIGVTRIAVHSGVAMVGNFGGGGRLDYTAHGSTINAVARLEAANKVFGTRICISEASRVEVSGGVWRPIADVRLRGISEPMRVYELANAARHSANATEAYSRAFAFIASNAEDARQAFTALPQDPLTAFQLRRIASSDAAAVLDV